jgi:hypothetical protein
VQHTPVTDPAEQERIINAFLAKRAAEKKSKRFKWADLFAYGEPLSLFAIILFLLGFELILKAHDRSTGVSTYSYFILFGAVWICRIECKLIAQSKKLDELLARNEAEPNKTP